MDILVADLGGTHSRFARFSFEDNMIKMKENLVLSSRGPSFHALLENLLNSWPGGKKFFNSLSLIVIAAAGQRNNGRISMTNADFSVTQETILKFFPKRDAIILNDFEAQARACLTPIMQKARLIHGKNTNLASAESPSCLCRNNNLRPIVTVGAGTGLGMACLLSGQTLQESIVLPSEAGHIAFPFEGKEELGFASYLADRHRAQVTAEHVLSGGGLAALYEYLHGIPLTPAEFTADPDFKESLCCRLFARFYGRFCKMMTLTLLPRALVITGGVAEKTPSLIYHQEFIDEFLRAGKAQKNFLADIPLWLNLHPQAGLFGGVQAGVSFLQASGSTDARGAVQYVLN